MARILGDGAARVMVPNENAAEYMLRSLGENKKRIVLTNVTKNNEITAAEVLKIASQWANGLHALGYRKGDVVSIYCQNSEEFLFMTLASLRLGLIVNPINPAATAHELRHYLAETQPSVILTQDDALLQKIEKAFDVMHKKPKVFVRRRSANQSVYSLGDVNTETNDVIDKCPHVDSKQDVAFIFFSSGTTGLPKPVMITHHNVLSNLLFRQLYRADPPSLTSAFLVFPMYHVGGIILGVLGYLVVRVTVVFMETWNLQQFLASIEKYKPQLLLIPPPIVIAITKLPDLDKYDTSSIQYIVTGAAPVKPETEENLRKRLNNVKILQLYGMTEATCIVAYRTIRDDVETKAGTCGQVLVGTEIKIIDPQTGHLLGPNSPGEICVRGPVVMKGYRNNPDATSKTIDQSGWLRSGDIGYYDEDEYIYISDRLKDLIKYKANQVCPSELEAVIGDYPDVLEVGVIGIPHAEAGEVPRAYVVKKEGSSVTSQAIQDHVKERLAYYKQLRGGVVFVPDLPKLPSGKILKRKLRELAKMDSKL